MTTNVIKDHIWHALTSDCYGENSVSIYGIALYTDIESPISILEGILFAISEAKYREPTTTVQTVAENFCSLIFVDASLYEVELGVRFADLNRETINTILARLS